MATHLSSGPPANRWEQYKVTACQVMEWKGWYVMFYIGFRDIDHAADRHRPLAATGSLTGSE